MKKEEKDIESIIVKLLLGEPLILSEIGIAMAAVEGKSKGYSAPAVMKMLERALTHLMIKIHGEKEAKEYIPRIKGILDIKMKRGKK